MPTKNTPDADDADIVSNINPLTGRRFYDYQTDETAAKMVQVGRNTASILAQRGIERRAMIVRRAAEVVAKGGTYCDVGKEFNITRQRVSQIVREYGGLEGIVIPRSKGKTKVS